MSPALESTDAKNKLEDLSGVKIKPGENPYKALIEACNDDAVRVFLWRRSRVVFIMLLWASTGWGMAIKPGITTMPPGYDQLSSPPAHVTTYASIANRSSRQRYSRYTRHTV